MLVNPAVAGFLIQLIAIRFAGAILRSSDVVKPCLPLESLPSLEVDLAWMFAAREPFYVPMGSSHLFRSYAEYLRGHSAADQADLDAMNLRISFTPTLNTTGYGEWFEQTCSPIPIKKAPAGPNQAFFSGACISTSNHSAATDTSLISTTDDTLIWTDNASVLLITRCALGKYGDWKVLSVSPDIPGVVKQQILNKAAEFGLDTSDYDIAGNALNSCSMDK